MRRSLHLLTTAALVVSVVACRGAESAAPATTEQAATTPSPTTTSTTTTSTTTTSTTTPPTTTSTTTTTTSTTSTTTTTTTAPPTTVAPTLPAPIDPPVEDGSAEETFEVGTIEIPKISLWAPMWEGIRTSTLDRGPGHWPGTAMPGEPGNVVVAGHRTSHHAEFRYLDALAPGDEVIMSTLAGRFVYRVVDVEIVAPDAIWIVDQTPASTATLFACHPPGEITERIVAHLELAA